MEPDQKDRILIKARDLFLQFGIRIVSMDDIASSLGVSKKTIYHYFADKDELVMGVMQQKMEESQAICVRDQQQAGDAIAELMRAMDAIDEHLSAMNPAVLFDLKKYHPLAFQMLEKHKNDFFTDRESAILFGIPACLIEGILVGRKYEKNYKIIKEIKKLLPNCYVCNLDGIVIA